MKIKNVRMFATETGSEKQLEIDELTVLASPESMAVIGQFFLNISKDMKENGTEHEHLQDYLEDFSYEECADIILCNSNSISIQ